MTVIHARPARRRLRTSLAGLAGLAGAAAVSLVVGLTVPADAAPVTSDPVGSVTVPKRTGDRTFLGMNGADGGLLVASEFTSAGTRYLVGREGRTLGQAPIPGSEGFLAMQGAVAYTTLFGDPASGSPRLLRTYDLVSGKKPVTRQLNGLIAATVTHAGLFAYDESTFGLVLERPDGTRTTLLAPSQGVGPVSADGTSAATSYATDTGTTVVVLIDVSTGAVQTLGETTADEFVSSVVLTPHDVVWLVGNFVDGSWTLHRIPRAGGADVTRVLPGTGFPNGLAATDTAALTVGLDRNPAIATLAPADPAAAVTPLTFAGPLSGPVASAGRLLIAVGGPVAGAGVFDVSATGASTRLSGVPAPAVLPDGFDLTGDSVHYTTQADTSAPGAQVWRRTVTGTTSLKLGKESLTLPRASEFGGISVSGTRRITGKVGAPGLGQPTLYEIFDGGALTGTAPGFAGNVYTMSGPYAALGDTVVRADGTVLVGGDGVVRTTSVFGPRAAWSDDAGNVWVKKLAGADDDARLVRAGTCPADSPCPLSVAIGSTHVLWMGPNGDLTAFDLRTGATRQLLPEFSFPFPFTADNGVAAWNAFDPVSQTNAAFAVDLTDPASTPVVVATGADSVSLDGHRIAYRAPGDVHVAPLPFRTPQRPLLLGVVATASFSASGPGWAPQIDLSKPVTGVTVTIRSGATVVRTLKGTSVDGSIRDVVWDGRDAKGKVVPAGTYTWSLAASAADGEGTAVDLDGGPVGGTVTLG